MKTTKEQIRKIGLAGEAFIKACQDSEGQVSNEAAYIAASFCYEVVSSWGPAGTVLPEAVRAEVVAACHEIDRELFGKPKAAADEN